VGALKHAQNEFLINVAIFAEMSIPRNTARLRSRESFGPSKAKSVPVTRGAQTRARISFRRNSAEQRRSRLSLSLSRWSSEIKNSILSMVHAREIVYRVTRDLAGKSRYGYVNVAVR